MTDNKRYQDALEFAREKHKGQFRIGGEEYISHPIAVAEMVSRNGFGIDFQIAALFHDLLEDTDATDSEILRYGNERVLKAVNLLTKEKGYDMAEYVARIKSDEIAFAVKAADRLHNLQCAVCADDRFKRRYILETLEWYMDFSPEIVEAVKALAETLDAPLGE